MKKKGFTIVELLLYMGLLTVFTVIMTHMFTSILDVQLESVATGAVSEDSRYLYGRLTYDIKRAASIVTPPVVGETTDSLTIMIGTVANTYRMSGDAIVLVNDAGVNRLNGSATRISGLSFQRLGKAEGKNSIRIAFTIDSTTQKVSGPETKTVTTTVALR
ncbi:hypothetical protein A2363_01875 [Candidatus Gottesmanbacteria bacterium RIFOXYB1_FULL_47_11]|uniref:Prepilin-type N-terminal cleavage/methylation domain-containing protein n=1 Tax=Candidatus Gottesmanbacteria bacterium RIFOXYB1_FULL_47_11 TaxID=1798401 RepID=A0A1F6BDH6_9BACT|nr:MAG: hypothetical protein A2363_01875 [Candidatus Gottesmanbacteria bacterium RIFOXYB1_FULL_47_11]